MLITMLTTITITRVSILVNNSNHNELLHIVCNSNGSLIITYYEYHHQSLTLNRALDRRDAAVDALRKRCFARATGHIIVRKKPAHHNKKSNDFSSVFYSLKYEAQRLLGLFWGTLNHPGF